MSQPESAEMSVVVALVSGETRHLHTCLTALAAQDVRMEILVPYDEPCAGVTTLGAEFPAVRFVAAEGLDTARARTGASREHHDLIRMVGLREATAPVIALVEDVGRPGTGWARGLLAALERHPEAGAVGGAITCSRPSALHRAVSLADFWRYLPPLPDTESGSASDANVAYRRPLLEATGVTGHDTFRETIASAALIEAGHSIRFAPDAALYQERSGLGWREALRERFVWGRSFAFTRVAGMTFTKRLVFAALCPGLPLALGLRVTRIARDRGSETRTWLPVLPLAMLLFGVWSIGEAVGYITGEPS